MSSLIQKAWQEIQSDSQLQLSPWTKLDLYDYLIDAKTISLKQVHLSKTQEIHPDLLQSAGIQRYFYLGLLTIEKVFPIWHRDMRAYISQEAHAAGWDPLPYIMHKVTLEYLKGNIIEDQIVQEDWHPLDIPYWWDNLGNIAEAVVFTQNQAIQAIYALNRVVSGYTPYNLQYMLTPFNPHTSDKMLDDKQYNFDFTYHALLSTAYHDPNTPGWGMPRTYPIEFMKDKALAFWEWWLDEAIPTAKGIDTDMIDWDVFAKDKYNEMFIL